MNNIFLNQQPDPLLTSRGNQSLPFGDLNYQPYNQKALQDYMMMQQMMNTNNPQQKNWIGELDNLVRSLNPQVVQNLNSNKEYQELSLEFQGFVNSEIMSLISMKLNSNSNVIENIRKQIELINNTKNNVASIERENMSELTDYMKNYSHLTFDEYRKLKNGLGLDNEEGGKKKQ